MDERFDEITRERVVPDLFRRTMGNFPTGVAVVTAMDGVIPFGMTMNSLTSVSLAPCLLLVCPKTDSATGRAMRNTGAFAVSLLASGQADLCQRFVGADALRFTGLDYEVDQLGSPIITGAVAHFCCRLYAVYPGGDHDIMLGEVLSCRDGGGAPLVYHQGEMRQLSGLGA